jgi:CelD/BcsL family acetyltransferase involved in cellulose biosynthesis
VKRLHTRFFLSSDGFSELAPDWNGLLRSSSADTVFMTYEWQSTWWRYLGDGTPVLIAMRGPDGQLAGLAPLYRGLNDAGEWELNTVGCVDVSDYLDLIARRGHEAEVFSAFLDLLASAPDRGFAWDVVSLCNVPQESATLSLLGPMASSRGFHVTSRVQEVCPIIKLPASWDEYLEGLDGKDRRELRRKLRKATPLAGVEWYLFGPDHDLDVQVDRFLHLMGMSHPDKAEFLHRGHRAFMHAIARTAWQEGWLELAFLTVDGEPAATAFNFVYNNRTLLYNSGLDAARFLALSPGIVLTALLIEHSIQQGRELFDFLRGDEAYKYQLGGADTTVHQLVIRR